MNNEDVVTKAVVNENVVHINQIRNGTWYSMSLWESGNVVLINHENVVVSVPAMEIVEMWFNRQENSQ